jgi:hypothetical protein
MVTFNLLLYSFLCNLIDMIVMVLKNIHAYQQEYFWGEVRKCIKVCLTVHIILLHIARFGVMVWGLGLVPDMRPLSTKAWASLS